MQYLGDSECIIVATEGVKVVRYNEQGSQTKFCNLFIDHTFFGKRHKIFHRLRCIQ